MSVKLIANYAKRLGLPGYSSHQFSVSIETELQSLDNVREQSARLYLLSILNVVIVIVRCVVLFAAICEWAADFESSF